MFEQNLQDFRLNNPKAAALLSFVEKGSLELAKDATGSLILKDNSYFYHSPQSAKSEAKSWANSLPLEGVEYLVVFGLGLGYGYYALKEWLEQDRQRYLIFVEDDLRVLLHFLEQKHAGEILRDPQVKIFHIENSEVGIQVLQSISWAAYGKKMHIACLPFYEKARKTTFDDVVARIEYETSDIHLVLDEYAGYGISFFRNFWQNLFYLPGSYKGNKLAGMFRGCPAIVCAAGPSLEQHLEMIKGLRDKALIFSGGTSVNILLEAGIVPHFGAGIDPNPMQYLRFRQALSFQMPFFYRNRLLNKSLELVHGPRLYLKGGDGYSISDWFEKKCKIPGKIIGGGHSVANFIIEIAHMLGCSPIILVGYDLAYGKQLQLYAPGVEGHKTPQDAPVKWKDRNGNPIDTAWKWLLEAKWIEDFANDHPRMKLINATEGGLGLKDIPHMSLKEAEERYLTRPCDYDSLVHTAIQEAGQITATKEMLYKGTREVYESLERVKAILEKLITKAPKYRFSDFCQDPEIIILQETLKKEIAYSYILEVFDRMRAKLEYYRLQFAYHPGMTQSEEEALEMELIIERYRFLLETAVVNQLIIQKVYDKKT